MKKLLVLLFVAAMCIPSYGDILVYKTTTKDTVFNLTAPGTMTKETEKGYLVLDVDLATQDINEAQQVTYSSTEQGAKIADVVFHNLTGPGYIVAEYFCGDKDATLYGKAKLTNVGLPANKLVAKTLSGSMLVSNAVLGSGTMIATLDTVRTKAANAAGTPLAAVVVVLQAIHDVPIVADTTLPEPNVMIFDVAPHATSESTIAMTAHTATDATGPVEYLFTNVTDGNKSSTWQENETFTNTGLTENKTYTYNVRAHDSAAPTRNTTAPSADVNATTDQAADTNAPLPNPMTFAVEPNALSDSRITMTATEANDIHGVEYYFTNVTRNDLNDVNHNGDHDAWQDSATFIDTGLTPNTNYKYNVKARDKSTNQNFTVASADANAVTAVDTTPPDPNPATFAVLPHATGPTSIAMTATPATDATGPVEYQFWRTTGTLAMVRDWDPCSYYNATGLTENSVYGYKVRARDVTAAHNMTEFSDANGKLAQTTKTIQTQINDANAARGSSYYPVMVPIVAGTYNESLDINEPNITLISVSGDANTIIVSAEPNQSAIEISGQGVTIDGFTIKQGTLAPAPRASDPLEHTIWVYANYSTIQNCTIIGAGGNQACIFIGGRRVGPAKVGGTPIWDYNVATGTKGHNILDNVFRYGTATAGSGEGWGIFAVKLTDDCVISGNTFIGDANDANAWNTNEGGPATGIVIHSATKGSGTYAVTIEDNTAQYLKCAFLTFYACYPYNDSVGYMYDGQPESSEVNGVLVTGNTVHDLGEDARHSGGVAIKFLGAKKSDAYDPNTADLRIGGANGVIIKNNDLHDNGCGVYIREPTSAIDSRYGCVLDANNITIDPNNSIYGNITDGADPGYGVYNGTIESNQDGGAVNIDAQYNWWGVATGPYYDPNNTSSTGNQVSDGVNYAHYRTTAP